MQVSTFPFFIVSLLSSVALWLWNIPPAFFAPLAPELFFVGITFIVLALTDLKRIYWLSSRTLVVGYSLFGILLMESLVRGWYEWVSISRAHPLCLTMPGFLQRLECIFGAGVDQNYALRSLLTLLTGVGIFVALNFCSLDRRRPILLGIQWAGVSFAICSYLAHFGFIVIPEGRFDPVMQDRFCYLIGNPSWMAPLLAPSIIAAVTNLMESSRLRLINVLSIVPMIDVILRSQQRGGIIVALCVVSFLFTYAGRGIWPKVVDKVRSNKLITAFILIAGTASSFFLLPFFWKAFVEFLSRSGFGGRLASSGFVSGERLTIWKAAFSELSGHYLIGHGYATWFRKGALKVPSYGLYQHFDTAHNFFVQYIFEHGCLAMMLWLTAMICIIRGHWLVMSASRRWALGLIGVTFLPILVFQEIDFIRSGFYISMAAIGVTLNSNSETNRARVLIARSKARIGTAALGVACIFSAVLFMRSVSLGGYQYEANVANNYGPAVRWFRKVGTINFVSSQASKLEKYALYKVLKSVAANVRLQPSYSRMAFDVSLTQVSSDSADNRFIPVRARSFLASPDTYALDKAEVNDGRQLGMMLSWPPLLSTMALKKADGAVLEEQLPHSSHYGAGLWCREQCSLEFEPCSEGRNRSVLLAVANTDSGLVSIIASIRGTEDQLLSLSSTPTELKLRQATNITLTLEAKYKPALDGKTFFVFGGICNL